MLKLKFAETLLSALLLGFCLPIVSLHADVAKKVSGPLSEYNDIACLTSFKGDLYFYADADSVAGIFKYSINEKTVSLVFDESSDPAFNYVACLGDSANTRFLTSPNYMFFYSNHGIWRSDGTTAGTIKIKDLGSQGQPGHSKVVGDLLYFTTDLDNLGNELWRSDGTSIGTFLVKDIRTGTNPSNPSNLYEKDGYLYFSAKPVSFNESLWRTLGTEATTTMLSGTKYLETNSQSFLFDLLGSLYFVQYSGFWGLRDNTNAEFISDIIPTSPSIKLKDSAIYTGFSYLRYDDDNVNDEKRRLFRFDGDFGTPRLLKDFGETSLPLFDLNDEATLSVVNDKLYFTVFENGLNLYNIWLTDGTESGTKPVRSFDLNSFPGPSIVVDHKLYLPEYNNTDPKVLLFDGANWSTIYSKVGSGGGTFSTYLEYSHDTGQLFFATSLNGKMSLWVTEVDSCVQNDSKSAPGICGCNVADVDSDGDGTLDCQEQCPLDSSKLAPGACGCGVADSDSNRNGIFDCSYTKEFNFLLKDLKTKTTAIKVSSKPALKNQLKSKFAAASTFLNKNISSIKAKKGKDIKKLFSTASVSSQKLVKSNSLSFKKNLKAAQKALDLAIGALDLS